MATLTAREIFEREYGSSRNPITQDVIRIAAINETTAYELSYGKGIFDPSIYYGVSIAQIDLTTGKTTRSPAGYQGRVFHRLRDAEDYIKQLKRGPVFDE